MLTLLTVTKDCFEAFGLCETLLGAQIPAVPEVEWLVADLGETPVEATQGQQTHRMPPGTSYEMALRELAPKAQFDKALIIRDAAWYPSDYLATMSRWLDQAPLVAYNPVRHYRLSGSYCEENTTQPNFAAVGIRLSGAGEAIRFALRSSGDTVRQLWAAVPNSVLVCRPGVVMLWGLPGSTAFPAKLTWTADGSGTVLKQWVGPSADVYSALAQEDGAVAEFVDVGGVRLATFRWKGQLRYQCPECGWDTYDSTLALKHWTDEHSPQRQVAPGPVLFDADDKPIEKEIHGGINI